MKAIHTSDWHIGQTFYGIDRSIEHLHFLEQLCHIVKEEQPDVFIISGDVYDSVAPSIASQKLYNRMLLQLHATLPEMKIVVTAGNHDSSSRLELNEELWSVFDVNIVGNIERKENIVNYERHIIEIKGPHNKPCCYIIAIPYIYHANYPAIDDDNISSKMYAFHQRLIDMVNERNSHNIPIIMTGHLAVSGANIKGHETTQMRLVYENIEELGKGYDYLALGHIHHPQQVIGTKNARYSGSPFPMSFDEDYQHSISIIEIEKHGDIPTIKVHKIEPLIPLCTIPSDGGGDINEVLQAIEQLDDNRSYIRVKLKVADVIPMNERRIIEEKFNDISSELCEISPVRQKLNSQKKEDTSSLDIQQLSPMEIAMDYYSRLYGCEMDDELKKMFFECMESVEKGEREKS